MTDPLVLYDAYSPIIDLAAIALAVFLQHRYHVINRLGKWWAKLRNKPTELSVILEYAPAVPFAEVKGSLKQSFRTLGPLTIVGDSDRRMDFSVGIFRIAAIDGADGNVIMQFERTASGINDLRRRIDQVLDTVGTLTTARTAPVLGPLVYCDLKFALPYHWEHLVLTTPKNVQVDSYEVSLVHSSSSRIKVMQGTIHVRAKRTDALRGVLDSIL